MSDGFPDIWFGKFGFTYLAEIKDGRKPLSARKLTAGEEEFLKNWKGHGTLFESVDDVIEFDRKRARRHSG